MSETSLLIDLTLLVGMAIPIVALAHRLSAPSLAGFLVAGILVGPNGFGLIGATHEVEVLAELGVALLLFAVGLELSLSHVRQWARSVFIGGGLQVGCTLFVVAAAAMAFGIPPGQAIFYGALAALSSTAIVTKIYSDRAELDTAHGRSVISILLFQDLCVLPVILVLPVLSGLGTADTSAMGIDFLRGLGIITALVIGGRFLVRRTLDRIVLFRDRDLFTLCVAFFCIGTAVVTAAVGFSIAIGAFIAGLVISESEYGLQALSDVLPFRAVFSGIFFISIGMLLDVSFVMTQLGVLVPLMAVLFALKVALVAVSVLAVGGRLSTALISGLTLAQIGEFSILLAAEGLRLGLFRDGGLSTVPQCGGPVHDGHTVFDSRRPAHRRTHCAVRQGGCSDAPARMPPQPTQFPITPSSSAMVSPGRYLARVLNAAGIKCIVVEHDANLVRRARGDGIPAAFGDGSQPAVLEHVGARRARVVVFAISSPAEESRGVASARDLNSEARIVVRTRYTPLHRRADVAGGHGRGGRGV